MPRASHSLVVSFSGNICSTAARKTSSMGGSPRRQLRPPLRPRRLNNRPSKEPVRRPKERILNGTWTKITRRPRQGAVTVRGLGLIRFIRELFMLQMLKEHAIHECIKKLLANAENPEEEDVESLCKLLTT